MYRFMIAFLEMPYNFFKQYTVKQYAGFTWYIIALCLCLFGLVTMCESTM